MNFSFHNPVRVRFGRGCVPTLVARLAGAASPSAPILIVTGRQTLQRTGLAALVDERRVFAFAEVSPNPGPAVIDAGAAVAREIGSATIVGLGGGSALDAAKALAGMLGHCASIREFQRRCAAGEVFARRPRLIQIPTTAGTGSEVTRWASIWSDEGEKSSVDNPRGYADEAWIDPALSHSMDARLTAASGLDTMAHAMESLWGLGHQPVADAHACAALTLVGRQLLPAVQAAGAPGIEEQRQAMSLAALHAGLALSQTASAAAHALSYRLTGVHGLEHGLAVGLLCRGLLPLNAARVPERVALLLSALGVDTVAGAQRFIDSIFEAAGITPGLEGQGISAASHPAIVDAALGADRLANNPGELGRPALTALLESIA